MERKCHTLHLIVVYWCGSAKLEKAAPEKTTENKFRNKPRESEGGRGGGAGRNPNFKPNQGRGGGRGQWVMPTGTAFFSGNATAPLPPVPAAKPDNVFRISRPNEDLLQAPMRPQVGISLLLMPWSNYCGSCRKRRGKLMQARRKCLTAPE